MGMFCDGTCSRKTCQNICTRLAHHVNDKLNCICVKHSVQNKIRRDARRDRQRGQSVEQSYKNRKESSTLFLQKNRMSDQVDEILLELEAEDIAESYGNVMKSDSAFSSGCGGFTPPTKPAIVSPAKFNKTRSLWASRTKDDIKADEKILDSVRFKNGAFVERLQKIASLLIDLAEDMITLNHGAKK